MKWILGEINLPKGPTAPYLLLNDVGKAKLLRAENGFYFTLEGQRYPALAIKILLTISDKLNYYLTAYHRNGEKEMLREMEKKLIYRFRTMQTQRLNPAKTQRLTKIEKKKNSLR